MNTLEPVPEYTAEMDHWMRVGIQHLRDDLAAGIDTGSHLRKVRELADPQGIALEVSHGAAAC